MGVGLEVVASFTLLAWIIGVITMNMISRTSITSTMGVTLILELIFSASLARMFIDYSRKISGG
jgi:hypothetical protein